jgi:hypothetical protein
VTTATHVFLRDTPGLRLETSWTVAAGVALGVVMILSPLTVVVTVLAVMTTVAAGRGLPGDERRWLTTLLIAALAARVLVVVALSVASIPLNDDQNAGILFGDEQYSLGRSLRTRNILLGIPASKFDYQVMFDSYAKTRYMTWLSWLQVTFGPSPYGVRLLNGVLFVGGAALLYRLARRGFGVVPALGGLATLLFLPSLFFWSVSLLKESMYFLFTVVAIAGAALLAPGSVSEKREHAPRRAPGGSWRVRVGGAVLLAASLWVLADLRPGAVLLTGGGLLLGVIARWCLQSSRRVLIVALALAVTGVALARSPSASARVLDALTAAAKQHTGHVFTVGHAYKTLDEKFYANVETPSTSRLVLTPAEAARYVARSGLSFVTVPFPWQVTTKSELAFVPEQILWYLIVVMALAGVRPAWRRDPLLAALLVGYVLPTAAVLALVNGNVGTLVRLRGLVTPFLVWIAALGCAVALQRLVAKKKAMA